MVMVPMKKSLLQPQQADALLKQAPLFGRALSPVVREGITLLRLNAEGLTKAKTDVLVHLAQPHKVAVILLQETHVKESSHLKIPGYTLAAFTKSDVHGTATFVNNRNTWRMWTICPEGSAVEWTAVDVEGATIVNVCKPPRTQLSQGSIPGFKRPCIYAEDCHSTTCGWRDVGPMSHFLRFRS